MNCIILKGIALHGILEVLQNGLGVLIFSYKTLTILEIML